MENWKVEPESKKTCVVEKVAWKSIEMNENMKNTIPIFYFILFFLLKLTSGLTELG